MFLLSSFWQKIEQLDQQLFILINRRLANPVFDGLMPVLRYSVYWLPLYAAAFLFVLIRFRLNGLFWILCAAATVGLTDITGTYLVKHTVQRLRPCADPHFSSSVRLVVDQCSGGYSFISNHAANHFGMAVFFISTMYSVLGKWVWLALLWAVSIAFAQVYVGVHYPADVLGGALLGTMIGLLTAGIFNKRRGFTIFVNQPSA